MSWLCKFAVNSNFFRRLPWSDLRLLKTIIYVVMLPVIRTYQRVYCMILRWSITSLCNSVNTINLSLRTFMVWSHYIIAGCGMNIRRGTLGSLGLLSIVPLKGTAVRYSQTSLSNLLQNWMVPSFGHREMLHQIRSWLVKHFSRYFRNKHILHQPKGEV